MFTKILTICAINFAVLFLLYEGFQYWENLSAQHRVGECFLSKTFPETVEILDIRDGKYRYRIAFLFIKMDKDDLIEKFDQEIAKGYYQINCETGEKL